MIVRQQRSKQTAECAISFSIDWTINQPISVAEFVGVCVCVLVLGCFVFIAGLLSFDANVRFLAWSCKQKSGADYVCKTSGPSQSGGWRFDKV